MMEAKAYDQFYTKPSVAADTVAVALDYARQLGYDLSTTTMIEPSAGNGSFLGPLKQSNIDYLAFDIDPKNDEVKPLDFLTSNIATDLPKRDKLIVIGNPPFGKRARLAIDFINKAFDYADTVVFILPLQFYKYSAQKQIDERARLIYTAKLPEKSFTFLGEDYGVRCCIQIWTLKPFQHNLRITSPPATTHPDFDMWQYNNTRQAEKYFDKKLYGWDFAVPRQGYKDYSHKAIDPTKMDRKTQWIFFKAHNRQALDNLKQLDFDKLSHKNTSTPGFGKADVVEEYRQQFDGNYTLEASTSIHTFQLGEPRPNLAETLSPFGNL
ncbi:hypothetical protein B7Y94_03435 [Candidatus Saccharibacteria bacterium 32-49-12]|nr:MAG: hypothetical protein B7Y94_03435 [Candidatus Saccharibacteria bacterium 32-49-12]